MNATATVTAPADPVAAPPAAPSGPPAPKPRRIALPLGNAADFFTREQLTHLYRCSHGELGRLLTRKQAPLPVRFDGQIIWFADEVMNQLALAVRTLERWRQRR